MDPLQPLRYRILRPIGQGGMGSVSLAEDTELGRKVALKFVTPTKAGDTSARQRLVREAEAAARLDHPFICKVYEVGESGDQPFIAMEYLEGTTLKERIAQGPIPMREALRLAAEIAEALDCAQQHGIVHRDLKPANVMLTSDGHVKVMDFGIAKRLATNRPDATDAQTMTATAGLTGTLAYMSPEQLRGEPVDSRSDIFAFGLVLYEMLAGRHPFARGSPLATAEAILSEPVPPLARHMTDPPALLEHIQDRLLAREARDRFQTFRDVRNELVSIAGASGAVSVAHARTRRRWSRTVAVAAVLVVAGALVVWQMAGWLSQPALAFNQRDWIVIADVDNQTGDPVFDRSLSTALNIGLSQSQYVNVLPASRVGDALQRMQRPPADPLDETLASEVAVREGAKAVVACSIAQVGSVYQLTAQLVDPQTRAPVRTESVRADGKDKVLPALDELATRMRRNLGESLNAISKQHVPLPKATTASLDALKLYVDAGRAPDPATKFRLLEEAVTLEPDFAMAHATLGLDYYLQSDRSMRLKGEAHVARALGLLDRLSFRERLLITALAEDSRGNRDAAVAAYKAYLTAYPDDSEIWFRLGWTYMATLRQFEPAAEAFKRAIAIDPSNSSALVNLATSYTGLHRDQEGREAYERAFALRPSEMMGPFVNQEYGFTLVRLGDVDRAEAVFAKMIAENDPGRRARGHRSLALLEMYRGHYKEAAAEFGEAIAIEQANNYPVSEFRDRVLLAGALLGRGQQRKFDEDMDRLEALIGKLTLSPEWLRMAVKLFSRNGRSRRAEAVLSGMQKTLGDPTSDSSANRNVGRDEASVNVARGEVALAAGKANEAVERLETASQIDTDSADTLESLARAYLAAGRIDDAAHAYEQLIADRPLGTDEQRYWFDAHLRLADIRVRQGNPAAARALYENILAIWQDGDEDLVALKDARDGLARAK